MVSSQVVLTILKSLDPFEPTQESKAVPKMKTKCRIETFKFHNDKTSSKQTDSQR